MGLNVKDPVCGGMVDISYTLHKSDVAGFKFFFCSEACRQLFEDDPDFYIRSAH